MINDSISDLFTRLRNACFIRQEKVIVPYNRTNQSLLNILAKHGFIVNFKPLRPSTLPGLHGIAALPEGSSSSQRDKQRDGLLHFTSVRPFQRRAAPNRNRKSSQGDLFGAAVRPSGSASVAALAAPPQPGRPEGSPTRSPLGHPQLVVTLKYKKNQPIIRQLKRISRPSCRIHVNAHNIPQSFGNIVLLSTSKGILSDREAKNLKIGGEILGFVA